MAAKKKELKIVIVGGGPSGVSCGINLIKYAKIKGQSISVLLFESKNFKGKPRYNQCIGVLSPPIKSILEKDLNIKFPAHIVQRYIKGYFLNSTNRNIYLEHRDEEPSYALRRIAFDDFFMQEAEKIGIERINSRVTDIELFPDKVTVYSDNSPSIKADVVVGAFGLDDGTCHAFERSTKYVPPNFLESIITKLHPPKEEDLNFYKDAIHAFIINRKDIEFGAITPKGNHITINIAGKRITSESLYSFVQILKKKGLLPFWKEQELNNLVLFKGRFPITPALNMYDKRYIIIGDAAGMMRPFKGKGINSAILTGEYAARAIIYKGISRSSFDYYYSLCKEITEDLPYGKLVRFLANLSSNHGILDYVIKYADKNEELRNFLFYCVSGQKSYKGAIKGINRVKFIREFLGI